jgi:hypothetical protein
MVEWLKQLAYALSLRLKSRARLEAENLVLTQLETYYDAVRGLFIQQTARRIACRLFIAS